MLPLELLAEIDHAYPLPLPPATLKASVPRGARLPCPGKIDRPGPTLNVAVALLPSESTTCTVSVVEPDEPAV